MSNTPGFSATVNLRDYQIRTIAELRATIHKLRKASGRAGCRILVVIPTGGGKTLTSASMLASAVRKNARVLFAAHRKELIDQTARTFARIGVTEFGIIRAKDVRRDPHAPIQIASVQTLAKRGKPEAVIVFIDEAHRSCAKTYVKHLIEAYPDAIIVGLTATPERADGKPLGNIYEAMVIGATYSELIASGHIVEPQVYGTPVLPDLASVRTTAGDYNQEDLEAAVNRKALIGNVVDEWKRRSEGRKTVVFGVSVAHSKALRDAFADAGVLAGHLDGTMGEPERDGVLADLASGKIVVLCNVGVLCEGWDMPECKCLVLARPTKSLALYMQMAGRILRPFGDLVPIILDHGGNFDRHGAPTEDREWSLEARVKKRGGVAPSKACPSCFAYVAAAARVCPHCGAEFPIAASPPPPDEDEKLSAVELVLRKAEGDQAELAFFRKLATTAKDRGWKPGAVYNRFKERFEKAPPDEWMRPIKRLAKEDADWSAKLSERAARAQRDADAAARQAYEDLEARRRGREAAE